MADPTLDDVRLFLLARIRRIDNELEAGCLSQSQRKNRGHQQATYAAVLRWTRDPEWARSLKGAELPLFPKK